MDAAVKKIRELYTRIDELEEQCATQADELKSWKEISELNIDQQQGSISATFRADFTKALIALMAGWFRDCGGTNYVEVQAFHPETGMLLFTMQRQEGKTSHQLRVEAEEQRDALLAQRDALVEDMKEIGKRADLIMATLDPRKRYVSVRARHDIHGQAGMISALAKVRTDA